MKTDADSNPRYVRYNVYLLAMFVALVAPLLPAYLFVLACNENLDTVEIARRQQQDNGLYSSIFYDDEFIYKTALYRLIQPDIVVVGSSRVLSIRSQDFKGTFVNMGRAMRSLKEGRMLVSKMLEIHKPKLVVLGIDFWWFHPQIKNHELADSIHGAESRPETVPFRTSLQVFGWLKDGRVKVSDVARVLLQGAGNRYGVPAVIHDDGFDRNGTYHYQAITTGAIRSNDAHFGHTLKQVAKGNKAFMYGDAVDPQRWNQFISILDDFRNAGVPVVLYLPPVAPTVLDAMKKSGGYAYIDELRQRLARLNHWYLDAFDPSKIPAMDCEFLDGTHDGEVLDQRLLIKMASLPDSPLMPYIDMAALKHSTVASQGRAVIRDDALQSRPEVDFLEIGCIKR